MSSSESNESSLDNPATKHGVMTYHLLEGLKGQADQDKDGLINIEELFRYVEPQVERTSEQLGSAHTPKLIGDREQAREITLARNMPNYNAKVRENKIKRINEKMIYTIKE